MLNSYFITNIIMGNMSYCRFNNTSISLQDCYYNDPKNKYSEEEDEPLSKTEERKRKDLLHTMVDYLELLGAEVILPDNFYELTFSEEDFEKEQ